MSICSNATSSGNCDVSTQTKHCGSVMNMEPRDVRPSPKFYTEQDLSEDSVRLLFCRPFITPETNRKSEEVPHSVNSHGILKQ